MFKDITIGQYYPEDSVIHRLDPRAKIIIMFLYIITLFFINNYLAYFFAFIYLIFIIKLSKVPLKFIIKGLKPLKWIIIITFVINIFLIPGEVIWRYGIFKITDEGLTTALLMAFRLTMLVMGTSLLTLTTSPIEMTDGIEELLKPLRKIGVPSHEIAMMMTIALRFIPTLIEETDKIMKAQIARGADFESGNLFSRAKNLIPLLVPLFVTSFRRADELAIAMEARCYKGGEGRTKLKQLEYKKSDYLAYLLNIGFFIFLASIKYIWEYFIWI